MDAQSQPHLRLLRLGNMSVGLLGLQFGFVAQMAVMSLLAGKFGAQAHLLPLLLLALPLTALLLPPLIGAVSDCTWNRLGRRRPYLLSGAGVAALALLFLPLVPSLAGAAILLWLFHAGTQSSLLLSRAWVVDGVAAGKRTIAYATQSFFIGLGAASATSLPWLLQRLGLADASANSLPQMGDVAVKIGAGVLLVTVLWSLFTTKEEAPEDLEEFARTRCSQGNFRLNRRSLGIGTLVGALLGAAYGALWNQLTVWHPLTGAAFGFVGGFALGGVPISAALQEMPLTMKRLAVVQVFTGLGIACVWMFFTRATAQQVFAVTQPEQAGFARGTALGIASLSWLPIACCVAALLLPLATRFTSRRMVHSLALLAGGASLLATGYIHDAELWQWTMAGCGLALASVLCLPYAILSGVLPAGRAGVFLGIFHAFLAVPELLACIALEPFAARFFTDDPVKLVMLGGASLLAAAVATQFVGEGPLLTPEYQTVAAEEGILAGASPTEAPPA